MHKRTRLLNRPPKTLEERYFNDIRPLLYERHAAHHQYGVRKGTSLAEHLDSVCQLILTVTRIARVPEDKRGVILATGATHDLNKLDPQERKVKTLARDKEFLRGELEKACILSFVVTDEDLELARKLIERHSGHSVSDGARFLPEDEDIERWAAMLRAADLFDLGIPESKRFRKVENELTVAFGRNCNFLRIKCSEDRGYITALLLGACEEVLIKYGLNPLAIFPDGELFEGEVLPTLDLTREIAEVWQGKIDRVFGGNIEQLVKATKDGIKVASKAIGQSIDEVLVNINALLEKKKASFKLDKTIAEPFTAFTTAVRSQKPHIGLDSMFGALVQEYHTRLDRIREHGVGANKYEKIKQYYEVLRKLYEEVYDARPEKLLNDKNTLEAAYLFFFQEAQKQLKDKSESDSVENQATV